MVYDDQKRLRTLTLITAAGLLGFALLAPLCIAFERLGRGAEIAYICVLGGLLVAFIITVACLRLRIGKRLKRALIPEYADFMEGEPGQSKFFDRLGNQEVEFFEDHLVCDGQEVEYEQLVFEYQEFDVTIMCNVFFKGQEEPCLVFHVDKDFYALASRNGLNFGGLSEAVALLSSGRKKK